MDEEQLSGVMLAGRPLSPEIINSLKQASAATGVDFDFLVAQASAESGLRGAVHARQRHSSASGLFQFTAQTWLQMMHDHGAEYGHGDLAARIAPAANGHLGVSDRATEKQILDLRKDVKLAGIMAAELAKQNASALQSAFHRKANPAELHLAHLLGATGAIRFLRARAADWRSRPPMSCRRRRGRTRSSSSIAATTRRIPSPRSMARSRAASRRR